MVAVAEDRLQAIRAAFPKEGLFAEKEWLLSPDAFPLDRKFLAELDQLGHRLFVFQRACNLLYQLSVKGKQPEWVARYLDAGKPKELWVLPEADHCGAYFVDRVAYTKKVSDFFDIYLKKPRLQLVEHTPDEQVETSDDSTQDLPEAS